ncbi:O-methyltransferase [Cellulomonas sp. IC4_254]|uniref:O-methyltransferase n=1 Tax=Cellulomonas sp. IC4_254 TaxID=2714040 RepID=UPI00141F5356|nr:O-methyltransferase [Cellulomonas sp. IC4_254]NHT17426.1 hypothetical protein [Cellulomonas sp. IC4_254]
MAGPNYLTAPLKSITREMIVEISRRLIRYGALRDVTYVGLGSLEFVDHRMAYERLGIERLISIEAEHSLERLEFNRPYSQIEILPGTTNTRLPEIEELRTSRCVVWLDYTTRIRQQEQRDISYLANVLRPGSALFVCANRHASEADFARVQEEQGDYFDSGLRKIDYLGPNFADRQVHVADSIVRRRVSARADQVSATSVLDVRYADSAKMQLLGWIFAPTGEDAVAECRLEELDFTSPARSGEPLDLAWPTLTAPEWAALSRQMPADATTLVPPHKWVDRVHIERFIGVHRWGRPAAANA